MITHARKRTAFSLVEVLLAIFILGIGVIAVAALFPAGIAQQRHSVDDIIGPVVANNALSLLRAKLETDDFGTLEEFNAPNYWLTVQGDWMWSRPAFAWVTDPADQTGEVITTADGSTARIRAGDIAVFSNFNGSALSNQSRSEVPWNTAKYAFEPYVTVTQQERYYPMRSIKTHIPEELPQYVWDVMFRRYQGRILVSIFVYRVAMIGTGSTRYTVVEQPQSLASPWDDVQGLPYRLTVTADPNRPNDIDDYDANIANEGVWRTPQAEAFNNDPTVGLIAGTDTSSTAYTHVDVRQAWQHPRQWLLDQNNNVHQVLSRITNDGTGLSEVELMRPLTEMPSPPFNHLGQLPGIYSYPTSWMDQDANGFVDTDIVSDIWYIPAEIEHPVWGPLSLTPVYLTVREL